MATHVCAFRWEFISVWNLTLLLLHTTCSVLANSVDPDQLATYLDLHCLSLNMWISIKNSDQVIWLAGNWKWTWHLNLFSKERVNSVFFFFLQTYLIPEKTVWHSVITFLIPYLVFFIFWQLCLSKWYRHHITRLLIMVYSVCKTFSSCRHINSSKLNLFQK